MDVVPADPGDLDLRTAPTGAVEAALSSAFDQRRAAARRRIQDRLGGFDLVDAIAGTDDAVAALTTLDPAFHQQLVDEDVAEHVIAHQAPGHPQLAHIRSAEEGGRPVASDLVLASRSAAESDALLPGRAYDALRAGETLIAHRIDQFDTGALRSFCEDLEQQLGTTVGVNTYLSHRGADGFGAHWDDHAVLILQVHGRKLWEVFEPMHLSPLPHYVQRHEVGAVAWSGVLLPGQALLIPRGWSHRVTGLDERSVHHTVALNRPSFLDVVDAAFAGAGPLDPDADPGSVDAWVRSACGDALGLAAHVLATNAAAVPARPRSGFGPLAAWEQGEDVVLEVLAPGRAVFVDGGPDGDGEDPGAAGEASIALAWSHAVVQLSDDEASTLAAIVATGPLASGDASDGAVGLVRELVSAGLARVRVASEVPA